MLEHIGVDRMKKLGLTILAIVASIFASSASAADPADVQRLKNTPHN